MNQISVKDQSVESRLEKLNSEFEQYPVLATAVSRLQQERKMRYTRWWHRFFPSLRR